MDSNQVGATRLVSKVHGTPQVDELRPITLLNSDYKLLSKLLVRRIKPSLPQVIKSDQLCTVGKKNILFGVNNILSSILYINDKKKHGCVLSLDFFKAYDRVLIDYLLKVMKKMNFSSLFCSWIQMMHNNASTRFILEDLSDAITVMFSIRQGDPLSMILYILYIEPLLNYLGRQIAGIDVAGIAQKGESYCDDVNVLTSEVDDLVKVENIVVEFEAVSGAILSRSKKCKIMGFGKWKNKSNWPLAYLKTEKEIKIFGIYFCNSYRAMLSKNWGYRFDRFNGSVKSWSSRSLPSLSAKIEVLKTFALSRLYYLASVLPVSKGISKKIETVMGKFIWNASGWLLRVAIDELKNRVGMGGLNLVCINSMCKSLLLSQLLRLLKSSDTKTIDHVAYWIGDSFQDLLPGSDKGHHPKNIPEYYAILESLLLFGRIDYFISPGKWTRLTNKMIYLEEAKNFVTPKVELESSPNCDFRLIWRRISSSLLSMAERDICFLLVHNKLPVRERLFRVCLAVDPHCLTCNDGSICDVEHFFSSCSRVDSVWQHVRKMSLDLIGSYGITNKDLINFSFPKCNQEQEVIWLLGSYIHATWEYLVTRSSGALKKEEIFGYLTFKYKKSQFGARFPLKAIRGLID